jgi:hypothetical protein
MAKKEDYKPLDDSEIVTLVENNIKMSVGYYDSDLSRERQRVTQYLNAALPKPQHDGNSKYVSQTVFDAVSSMSAALLETFSSGNKICKFAPQGPEDVQTAEVCSAYVDFVLHRQNDFFSVARDVIHDGLTSRVGVAKIFWDVRTEEDLEEFDSLTQDELDMLLASDENLELVDSETDDIGLVSGTISRTRDTSQVVIESIPPEQFLVEPQLGRSLEDAKFCAHRVPKTISELRELYDDALIDKIGDHEDIQLETDPEVLARTEEIGADRGFNAKGYQDQVRTVLVYEAYIMLDVEGTGTAVLHRVVKAGNVLLEKEQVKRRPFITFTPLPIPHTFYGSNFAEKLIATQNAKTVLTRSILDHTVITNNPRYLVVKGGLSNPRELADNRIGGIVNTTRVDAISPMPQGAMNPFVFQTIQLLDEDVENNTGVSKLSQGLNKDAISKQNSAAMVEQLATMSQQRQKVIARNFANQFVKPLYFEAYRLCVENEDQEKIIELAGNYVQVDPAKWTEKRDVMVELRLGYGEQEREAEKLLTFHSLFSQDPTIAPMYGLENKYRMLKAVLQQSGILNVEDYLTPPEQLPPPQPDPAQEMQMQMAQKQLELQERQTAIAEQRLQLDAMLGQGKLEIDVEKAQAAHALQSDNQDLKEAQFAHKKNIDEAELDVLQRQSTDVRGIASPTG